MKLYFLMVLVFLFNFPAKGYCSYFQSLKDILTEGGYCLADVSVSGNRMDCPKDKITVIVDENKTGNENEIAIYGLPRNNVSEKVCHQFLKERKDKGALSADCSIYDLPIEKKTKDGWGMSFRTMR